MEHDDDKFRNIMSGLKSHRALVKTYTDWLANPADEASRNHHKNLLAFSQALIKYYEDKLFGKITIPETPHGVITPNSTLEEDAIVIYRLKHPMRIYVDTTPGPDVRDDGQEPIEYLPNKFKKPVEAAEVTAKPSGLSHFTVTCDETNNSTNSIAQGRLNICFDERGVHYGA